MSFEEDQDANWQDIPPRFTHSPDPEGWTKPPPDARTPSPPPPRRRSIYPTRQGEWRVVVVKYNPEWPVQFAAIAARLTHVFNTAQPPVTSFQIEHIGSTSIPGMWAKPNIDVLVTLPNTTELDLAKEALKWEVPKDEYMPTYTIIPHGGGIAGRESYKLLMNDLHRYARIIPEQSVYLINTEEHNRAGNMQIRGYRDLRNTLCLPENEDLLKEYSDSKKQLAQETFKKNAEYSQHKNQVVRKILKRAGWTDEEIDEKEPFDQRGPRELTDEELEYYLP